MLGQAPWARLSPSGPAVLLLALCAGVTTQDICSSPGFWEHGGNYQAPVLFLNTSRAQEGETVLVQCAIDAQFPATRVVFCKNGLEEFSLRAQHGKVIYALVLNVTSRNAGTYTCGYQQRNESNWVQPLPTKTSTAPQLPMPGSRTPSPQARRWQWRPSASSSWLQAAGLPSGKVREWGKAGGKAEAVGVLPCCGAGAGGKAVGGSWGCAAGADGAWGRWLWAAQLGRLLRELGSFSLRPPAPRREPGLGSNLACAPQPLFFLQVPAEGDAQGLSMVLAVMRTLLLTPAITMPTWMRWAE
ncbi:uncharacterized protein [Anser cygnoides]|uniref:uncharacterized protein isoform X2 n=1 Tax=Anser cygnoides TaxID=8845 RepID=UPI0034D336F6